MRVEESIFSNYFTHFIQTRPNMIYVYIRTTIKYRNHVYGNIQFTR